jgi:chromosomal replication initiation ATPase DnaA|tara:strand:+ start:247 stop:549 length:303 start_codon:yes stop_codon:yes gene_type:complete
MKPTKKAFNTYAEAVAKQFELNLSSIFKKTKKREVVDARQMLYYLCMERPIRISYIQRFLQDNGYDVAHSTIIHGYKKAKQMIDNDEDFKEVIKQIKDVH